MANAIMILGASGFIGQKLVQELEQYPLILVSRNPKRLQPTNHQTLSWTELEKSPEILKKCSTIISLCGQSLLGIWTKRYRKNLIDSRIQPLHVIAKLLHKINHQPHMIVASGVGFYGYQNTSHEKPAPRLGENSTTITPYFLAEIAESVENALPENLQANTCYLRFGVVLDPSGGMLAKIKLPTKFGLGCIWGSGHQPMSWVSLDDATSSILFLITQKATGAFNICAPYGTTHQIFMKSFAAALGSPCFIRIPSYIAKLGGPMINCTLLKGQNAYPERLTSMGFEFNDKRLQEFLSRVMR